MKKGGSSTNTRRPMRRGSRSIRNAHSRPNPGHPRRRCRHAATEDVDRLADAQHHRMRHLGLMARHPGLLLGCAEADQHDAWLGRLEHGHGGRVLVAADRKAHPRADRSHDLSAEADQVLGRFLGRVVAAADHRDRDRVVPRLADDRLGQQPPGDGATERLATQPRAVDEAHSVRDPQARAHDQARGRTDRAWRGRDGRRWASRRSRRCPRAPT